MTIKQIKYSFKNGFAIYVDSHEEADKWIEEHGGPGICMDIRKIEVVDVKVPEKIQLGQRTREQIDNELEEYDYKHRHD